MKTILSVIDIIRALSELIESKYPNYPVVDMDIDEDYPRPSYFIDVEDVNTSWVATDYIKESSNLKIVFFAENRYEGFLNLLDMKNNLTMLFDDPIRVSDEKNEYYVKMLTTASDLYKQDKVLTFNIQADLIQKVERTETQPYMEHLDVNMLKG
nr:MAG TPA: tail completion protein [Caudoviricetes sp.]